MLLNKMTSRSYPTSSPSNVFNVCSRVLRFGSPLRQFLSSAFRTSFRFDCTPAPLPAARPVGVGPADALRRPPCALDGAEDETEPGPRPPAGYPDPGKTAAAELVVLDGWLPPPGRSPASAPSRLICEGRRGGRPRTFPAARAAYPGPSTSHGGCAVEEDDAAREFGATSRRPVALGGREVRATGSETGAADIGRGALSVRTAEPRERNRTACCRCLSVFGDSTSTSTPPRRRWPAEASSSRGNGGGSTAPGHGAGEPARVGAAEGAEVPASNEDTVLPTGIEANDNPGDWAAQALPQWFGAGL
mmetsp:Transcript_20616/g.57370  ORF Transcript_20616/g.57370 Transcript_20616/m.57370 type:complete len:304 (-) Transcript_20616:1396-2307(-)